ncbi:glucagon receptor [Egretta garzetta]|uniref:glucagon receptor n=1 Tax=Egretta garzetta TaxID=188379 RepID=UPI00163D3074|nr:glucagon receptor [Egretta garzetta]
MPGTLQLVPVAQHELVCNRTFDKFSCWPDTLPNSTASVPCPWFLPWYQKACAHPGADIPPPRGLAKSTLTLIPLLGIHEVVFAFITDEHAQGTLRYVKLFFDLFLSSFQGMLVAILYCFVNKEVQAELLKRWQRWKLGKDLAEENKQTYSHAPSARGGDWGHRGPDCAPEHPRVMAAAMEGELAPR